MLARINDASIFFDVASSAFAVEAGGLVEKPTIIALHGGLGFDHGYLRPGLCELADIAQVIFIDLRGNGRSERVPLDTCTLEQMADDVALFCKQLGIERPIVFGHSAGSFVALHMALRHPGQLGGLIICDGSPTVAPIQEEDGDPGPTLASRGSDAALAIASRVFSGEITEETMSLFMRDLTPFYVAPSNASIMQEILSLTSLDIPMMQHFMQVVAPAYDLRSQLDTIEVPALVIVGRHDWVCPPSAARFLARSMRNARLVEFENSGHFPFAEEPLKFFSTVQEFLNELTGGQ
ncbi:alpha/beta hydrolase [Rhizobium sp. 0TCS1.26]|uniref:alpha/beta fold hydrolase n=1 Tax=Rhizobium sp. 0TCS1.26 TaxID=3142623 RepID=UPI003D283763